MAYVLLTFVVCTKHYPIVVKSNKTNDLKNILSLK